MKKIALMFFVPVLAACSAYDPWAEADRIAASIGRTHFPDLTVSITDFGAVADRPQTPVHEAINAAIKDVAAQGGGTVLIPDSTYYTGPIELQSNVRLHLSDRAVLKFSTDIDLYYPAVLTRWEGVDCYNTRPLIYAYEAENIAITGCGRLDAQAAEENWWGRQQRIERKPHPADPDDPQSAEVRPSRLVLLEMGERQIPVEERRFDIAHALRPQFVNLYRCRTVLIEDVELVSSPFWVLHPLMCEDLIVRGVRIDNYGPNGDGCDPESCRNVLIEGCTFNTGDDCIAIKSGRNADGRRWNMPSENIVVRDCTMADGHGGVVIGSEISGGFRNLYVENCRMDSPNLDRVIRIKTSNARGGVIENIFVRNVEVGQCREAVLRINLDYEPREQCARGFDPTVRNVNLENVTCRKSKYGVWFCGLEQQTNLYDIRLKDCTFTGVETAGNHTQGAVGRVVLDNVRINGEAVDTLVSVD